MPASAIVVSTVSSAEITSLTADHPMFVANNVLEYYNNPASWRVSTGSGRANFPNWTTGADQTATGLPTYRAYDRASNSATAPAYTSANLQYAIVFDLRAGTDGLHTIDSLILVNHNLQSYGVGAVTMTVSFDDVNTFAGTNTLPSSHTTADLDLVITGLGTSDRIVSLSLPYLTSSRISNVSFIRLNFTVAASLGIVPQVGELIIGRRRQMSYFPNTPYDTQQQRSDIVDYKALSGAISRYVRNAGQRIYDPTFQSSGNDLNGLNQENELRAMFRECDWGAKPVVYINNPNSAPTTAPLCVITPSKLVIEATGPYIRTTTLHLEESAPYTPFVPPPAGSYVDLAAFNYSGNTMTARNATPSGLTQGRSAWTWSWWFRRMGTPVASVNAYLFSEADTNGNFNSSLISLSGPASNYTGLRLQIFGTAMLPGAIFTAPFVGSLDTAWHHFAVCWGGGGGGGCDMYMDNVALTTTLSAGTNPAITPAAGDSFVLGGDDVHGVGHSITPSHLDECFFASIRYSSGQVSTYLWNGGHPGDLSTAPGRVTWYTADNTAADSIGTNNLTLINSLGYTSDHP